MFWNKFLCIVEDVVLQNLQLHYRSANIQQIICAVEGDWNIYVRHINTTVLFKDIIILSNEFLFNHSLNYYYRDMTLMRQISQEKHKQNISYMDRVLAKE